MTIQQITSGPMLILDDDSITGGNRVQETTYCCRMTDTIALVGYADTGFAVGDQYRIYVATRSGMNLSLGPKNIIPGIGGVPQIAPIDTTRFLIVFADTNAGGASGTDRVMVGTIANDGTISWGTSAFVSAARQNNYNAFYKTDSIERIICLDQTNALLFTGANAAVVVDYTAYITPLSISGTTVTVGTPVTHTAAHANASPVYAGLIDSTHVAIGYLSGGGVGGSGNFVFNIIQLVGGVITVGTEFVVDGKSGYPLVSASTPKVDGLASGVIGLALVGTEGIAGAFWQKATTDNWAYACGIHLHFDVSSLTISLPEAAPLVFGEQNSNTTVRDYGWVSALNSGQVVYQSAPYQPYTYWWGSNGNRADLLGITGGVLSHVGNVIRYGDAPGNNYVDKGTTRPQIPIYPSGCRMDDSHALFIWSDTDGSQGGFMWGVIVGSLPVLRATPRTSRLHRVGSGP